MRLDAADVQITKKRTASMIRSVGKLIGCLALGAALAVVGVLVNAGPVSRPWLGFVLAVGIVMVGSVLCRQWHGGSGVGVYVLSVAVLTLWLTGFWHTDDVLVLPLAWQYRLWPLTAIVAATVGAWIGQPGSGSD